MAQDPYKVLGVSPDATDEEIKKAYRDLTKRYHPDLHPGDATAAEKMNEVNAAYDLIKNGAARSAYAQSSASQTYQDPFSGSYSDPFTWYTWSSGPYGYQGYQQQARQTERGEYTAARNYIRNQMYREALNALSGVPENERDARWYFLSGVAKMYLGNKIAALEDAKRALQMDPENAEYQRFVQTLQNGGQFYENYTRNYQSGLNMDRLCMTLCASQLCLGPLCGMNCCCC
ncbi:MAG: DnaJ domain-containing protein [Oscillospiraceae bacterium]|nr:DnaJ domain-containing protein [Oscillospiraceae bacterium]